MTQPDLIAFRALAQVVVALLRASDIRPDRARRLVLALKEAMDRAQEALEP